MDLVMAIPRTLRCDLREGFRMEYGRNAYGDVYDDEHEHLALNLTFIFLRLFSLLS